MISHTLFLIFSNSWVHLPELTEVTLTTMRKECLPYEGTFEPSYRGMCDNGHIDESILDVMSIPETRTATEMLL